MCQGVFLTTPTCLKESELCGLKCVMKNKKQLIELGKKYRSVIVKQPNEILFPLNHAAAFANELADLGELIIGVSEWKYIGGNRAWLVEVVGGGLDVQTEILETNLDIQQKFDWFQMSASQVAVVSAKVIGQFLDRITNSDTDFVSFIFNDPAMNDFLLGLRVSPE